MEISSTLLEQGLGAVNELALPVAGASCLYLTLCRAVTTASSLPAGRTLRPGRTVKRGVSLLGLAMTIGSPAAAASRRTPQPADTAAFEVRTEPGRFPPPRLPGSAEPLPVGGGGVEAPPWTGTGSAPGAHAAVHGGTTPPSPAPLFDRSKRTEGEPGEAVRALRDQWHAVLPGETLWSIAADRLGTGDMRRIARYWPRIHRANRDEIGSNPDLIRPGQVLRLPPESE